MPQNQQSQPSVYLPAWVSSTLSTAQPPATITVTFCPLSGRTLNPSQPPQEKRKSVLIIFTVRLPLLLGGLGEVDCQPPATPGHASHQHPPSILFHLLSQSLLYFISAWRSQKIYRILIIVINLFLNCIDNYIIIPLYFIRKYLYFD